MKNASRPPSGREAFRQFDQPPEPVLPEPVLPEPVLPEPVPVEPAPPVPVPEPVVGAPVVVLPVPVPGLAAGACDDDGALVVPLLFEPVLLLLPPLLSQPGRASNARAVNAAARVA
jgi:hypothetical protein